MTKKEQIDDFFKEIVYLIENNFYVDEDVIYENIVGLNINNAANIYDKFDSLLKYYDNIPNIIGYINPSHKYFCYFKNPSKKYISSNKYLKMYIPIDRKHIEKSAKDIFDFLSQNNIPHYSKIASEERLDDIVVRVTNIEDAVKLNNFIAKNKYILEGLISNNIFTFSNGKVSYSWDSSQSYNSVVASIVYDYIEELEKNDALNNASYYNFYIYALKKYKDVFENKNEFNNFTKKNKINNTATLIEYKLIFEVLLYAMDESISLDDFFKLYTKYSDNDYINYQIENFEMNTTIKTI